MSEPWPLDSRVCVAKGWERYNGTVNGVARYWRYVSYDKPRDGGITGEWVPLSACRAPENE